MELVEKLKILADSAKYDVSCVSSGSSRKNTPGGIGSAAPAGICHSFASDGRCISLLKILLSNCCIYDCAYCINRISNDLPRTTFTPAEIVDLTINFYRRNYIEGLFLSSAVVKNPDYTMEQILQVVRTLREEYRFNGYIHVKAIPGADSRLIDETGRHVDRMSVNIELPTSNGLKMLAPQKDKHYILRPMQYISSRIAESSEDYKYSRRAQQFVPAGQSTQLIVGATPDRDLGILKLSESLYKRYSLRRVFYSAYVPVSRHPALPGITKPPLLREHRLYQADWLLRFYNFKADELLDERHQDFDTRLDPKCDWALRNMEHFPVEVNKADYYLLLRVPGIGVRSARRILDARRITPLGFDELKKLGVVLKRARYFITCKGKYYDRLDMNDSFIRQNLLADRTQRVVLDTGFTQISMFLPGMFSLAPSAAGREQQAALLQLPSSEDVYASATGEL
jgi:putative DNA modification/repair radical SAM protein